MRESEVKVGDFASAIIQVWREDELPTITNFYFGKISEIIEENEYCFYVRITGLDRLIPIDRVRKLRRDSINSPDLFKHKREIQD